MQLHVRSSELHALKRRTAAEHFVRMEKEPISPSDCERKQYAGLPEPLEVWCTWPPSSALAARPIVLY
jgi:hypothetical protein